MDVRVMAQERLSSFEPDACSGLQVFLRDNRSIANWLFKDTEALNYFAGDVEQVPRNMWENLEKLRQNRGEALYADLMMACTHKYFPAAEARQLWDDILMHKYFMSEKMGRNVGIRVAALDFLDNHRGLAQDLRLLPERDLDCLLEFVNEDGLTGLYNHRYFQEQLRYELSRAQRYARPLSLLLIDLDNFKLFNDKLGHRQGDQLLQDIARFFQTHVRETDTVARYGGDEFAIILPETDQEDAIAFAGRLQEDFMERRLGGDFSEGRRVTLSIGAETFPSDATTAEELIEQADQALYRAKRAGKNRVRGSHETGAA